MDLISQDTTFPGGQQLADDSLRVPWIKLEGSLHDFQRPTLGGLLSTDADLWVQGRKGLHILGASPANAPALSRPAGDSDAWVVRSEGYGTVRYDPYLVRLPPVNFSIHFVGQWADRPLLAYEEQAIGNLTVGRGYDPDSASGDRVVAAEAKLEFGPIGLIKFGRAAAAQGISVGPYVFYDYARVANLDPGSVNVSLRSLGGGFELRLPYRLRADLYYAVPLDKPYVAAPSKPPPKVFVQIVFQH
jgi:hemolysin activation/secretion protein